ncbi:MAG: PIN domain-containing protein [Candidatus Pacearchaeota archaeon]|nr:PIN domain-containing protein [Candidatus Pacearchaeota archaeon]
MFKRKKSNRQEIRSKARRSLNRKISFKPETYVVDTSSIINKFIPGLIKKGLKGKFIIPNAVMAELENLANKSIDSGFIGLEEIAKLHVFKQINIYFQGLRPNEMQIKFAKSGEIDALIRDIARENNATLITSDLVQAKSSQAYGLKVLFLKSKTKREKKGFWFWKR